MNPPSAGKRDTILVGATITHNFTLFISKFLLSLDILVFVYQIFLKMIHEIAANNRGTVSVMYAMLY